MPRGDSSLNMLIVAAILALGVGYYVPQTFRAKPAREKSAEPARAEPPRRAEPAATAASDQIWECLPRPPENKVICHPIPNKP